jgi:AcrR family transcriptional regulator
VPSLPIQPPPAELPLVASQRAERADAARNREAILCAARRLLRDQGATSITMDRLACEAGVGKGTLFRRFGDRASLFHALLDDSERRLQNAFIAGPPPLGPGAPPAERLVAFGDALLELTAERGDLLLAAEPLEPLLRYESPVLGAYRAHLIALLEEIRSARAAYFAEVLLATLAPELIMHQLRTGTSLRELQDGWAELVDCLTGQRRRMSSHSVDPSTTI